MKWDDFQENARVKPYDVYVFQVNFKGKVYWAAISKIALDYMKSINANESEPMLCPHSEENKSSFDVSYRRKLTTALSNKNLMALKTENRALQYSFRQFFKDKLRASNLRNEEIALLMGYRAGKDEYESIREKIAEIYSRSALNTFDFLDNKPMEAMPQAA